MVEAKPSAPAIFYEEATNKPFTMLYGWPDHQRVRCFSTFDPNYFARFRSLRLKVLLGPQVNDSPRDYNALQAAMRPFQAALIIENSANPLPSSVSWIPWQHFRKQTEKASLVQKLALAQRTYVRFETLGWMFSEAPNVKLVMSLKVQISSSARWSQNLPMGRRRTIYGSGITTVRELKGIFFWGPMEKKILT
ncbi:hypothetical protein Vi05172_g7017 [Venturia inaequalis]|nr:hypothetical protein Vi05172_g7017 [Venturia inaequalis]